jgi:hypothetical protein
LLHNTVFHGNSLYEPLQVEAKFSTLLPDGSAPAIRIFMPKYIGENKEHGIPVSITEQNLAGLKYAIDGGEPIRPVLVNGTFDVMIDAGTLVEGPHTLRIDASDLVGHTALFESAFEIDNTPPTIDVFVKDSAGSLRKVSGSKAGISELSDLVWNITDGSGVAVDSNSELTLFGPNLTSSMTVNPEFQPEGSQEFSITGADWSGNIATRDIEIIIDTTRPKPSLSFSNANPQDLRGLATVVLGAGDPNIHSMFLQVGDRKSMNVTGMQEYVLDATEIPDGNYDLKLVATDIAGNEATMVMPIVVANNAPQVMLGIIAGLAAGGGIASVAWLVFARRRTNKS